MDKSWKIIIPKIYGGQNGLPAHFPNLSKLFFYLCLTFLLVDFVYMDNFVVNENLVSLDEKKVVKPIEDWIRYQIDDKAIPVIGLTITNSNNTIYKKFHHHFDIRSPIPSVDNSLISVASVSKLFTNIALLQLVEQGKVSLTDPITKYMPYGFAPKNPFGTDPKAPPMYKNITIFNLIRHTSGLQVEPPIGNIFSAERVSLRELAESMGKTTLAFPPQKRYKYSNGGAALVGYIVQVISEMPFEDYVQKYVLDPVGMTHCTFKNSYANDTDLATGSLWSYWDETTTDPSVFTAPHITKNGVNASGGLKCTLNEISNFLRVYLKYGYPLLKSSTFKQLITAQPLSAPAKPVADYEYHPSNFTQGLGMGVRELDGLLIAGHNGALPGYVSEFRFLPEIGIGIYAISTLDSTGAIASQLLEYAVKVILSNNFKPSSDLPISATRLDNTLNSFKVLPKTKPLSNVLAVKLLGLYKQGYSQFKLYQEYNLKYYRSCGSINELGWISSEDGGSAYPNGTLMSNGRIIFTPLDLNITNDVVTINQHVRDNNVSNIDLFYQPYIPLPPVSQPPNDTNFIFKKLIGHYRGNQDELIVYEEDDSLLISINSFSGIELSLHTSHIHSYEFKFPEASVYGGERIVFFTGKQGTPLRLEISGIAFTYGVTFTNETDSDPIKRSEIPKTIVDPIIHCNQWLYKWGYSLKIDEILPNPDAEAEAFGDEGSGSSSNSSEDTSTSTGEETPKSVCVKSGTIDVTLQNINSSEPVSMPSEMNEPSVRSSRSYFGGTTRQRWFRKLLTTAMMNHNFQPNPKKWWQFVYKFEEPLSKQSDHL